MMKSKLFVFTFLLLIGIIAGAQPSEGLRDINGTKLFIIQEGKGVPLIIIHGGPGFNHNYFRPYLDALAKKNKVIYYDQRACGQSAIPAIDSLSLSFFIEDLEAIRKLTGAKKVNLLGHSWGALLAINYGIHYPDHVGKMILSNPIPLNQDYQEEMVSFQKEHSSRQDSLEQATIINSSAFKNGDVMAFENLMKVIFRATFYDRSNLSKLNLNFPADVYKANRALYAGIGKDMASFDYYENTKAFSFPVLIVAGAADGIPMSSLNKLKETVPNGELIVFDKSGHFPFVEEPERFNREVSAFLKRK